MTRAEGLTPEVFVQRWAGRPLNESAAAQSHFNDLCELLGVSKPTDNRVTDSDYGFEARTDISASGVYATRTEDDGSLFYRVTTGSGPGFADVWKRNCFAWEYKTASKYRTLDAALAQLRIYAGSLGNPPLLIVSDIDRYEIHTNFTNYPVTKIVFAISDIAKPSDAWKREYPLVSPLEVLRKVFDDVDWFKPKKTRQAITGEFARDMGKLAIALRDAGNDPHAVAHLVMQIVFCFFAEDIGLLPRKLVGDLIERSLDNPSQFPPKARSLFKAMELGGHFGAETIQWFNGGLFKDVDQDPIIHIDAPWLGKLLIIARKDWDAVDPSIFGTLFERSLDPNKRSQIGAHYTSKNDIMLIVEPVVMQPLRRQWVDAQKDVAEWLEQRQEAGRVQGADRKAIERKQREFSKKIQDRITAFVDHVGSIKVLDPACGSGNFLYVTIQQLLDLEQEVRAFAARPEVNVAFTPRVRPSQLLGIDVNDYACELARVSIWIGFLQWLHANASSKHDRPILDPLNTIENRDAILKWADEHGNPMPVWRPGAKCLGRVEWPKADFIIGNPPFLGDKLLRQGLGHEYVEAMWGQYDALLPHQSDLCCYWFAQAHSMLRADRVKRCGLLATQNIRKSANRAAIDLIKESGDVFFAVSDREWVLEGASVHVSMVGFDSGLEASRILDGVPVSVIQSDLAASIDPRKIRELAENDSVGFIGSCKGGPFDVSIEEAERLLAKQGNPNRQNNSALLRPVVNSEELLGRREPRWIIDTSDLNLVDAAKFQAPFEILELRVKPVRTKNRDKWLRENWWRPQRMRPEMRSAVATLERFIVTPTTSKHRIFTWMSGRTLPDHQLVVFAREDDFFFGAVHSAIHEVWARQTGTQLREVESGFRYTPSMSFVTFPLPWPPGKEPANQPNYKAIAAAAKELNQVRENWLNPPEWIKPIEDAVDLFEDFKGVPAEALPLLRQSAIAARAAKDKRLKTRTLTNLYNERPGWLKIAHRKLDEAVLAAYKAVDPNAPNPWDAAWAEAYEPFGAGEITIIKPRGKKSGDSAEVIAAKKAVIAQRQIVDEKILANLLRLNQQRAAAQGPAAKPLKTQARNKNGKSSAPKPRKRNAKPME